MKRLLSYIVIVLSISLIVIQSCSKEEITVYDLTSEVIPFDGGIISPALGTYDSGEQVSISAIPFQGYSFKNWNGNISGTNNPYTFTIKSDTKVIAIFEENDSDGDGVSDIMDECPNTPAGENVNSVGCSDSQEDTDGDSVNDAIDICPNTPVSESVDTDGCSESQKDSDSDGVTDDLDQCPETGEGFTVDDNGCADNQKDSDNDGFTDDLDECPETEEGLTVDDNGCADNQKDSDSDGVNDDIDLCSETPAGESVDSDGCAEGQHKIGDFYQGGIVFLLDETAQHGLVCAVSDAPSTLLWTNAMSFCSNYSSTVEGVIYDDWFLPSKDELNQMYINKAAISAAATANGGGAFKDAKNTPTQYWSSTVAGMPGDYWAYGQDFYSGYQDIYSQIATVYVRPVRAF